MTQAIFAGAIFSETESRLIIASAVAILSLIIGIILYVIIRLFRHFGMDKIPHLKLWHCLLIGLAGVITTGLVGIIIPAKIKDMQWKNLQNRCAKEVGYQSPADDNNPQIATSQTQQLYWQCTQKQK